jgi:xanthine dehydrogenase YagR molybdenum-binding subunit
MTATTTPTTRAVGTPRDRVDGPDKVRGTARYAFDQPVDHPAYLYPVQATIAAGRITGIDTSAAEAEPGVLAVLTHENAPKLAWTDDPEIAVLHTDQVLFRGQVVAAAVAETSETARHAAGLVRVDYEQRPHDVELRADHSGLHKPVNAAFFGAGGGELQPGLPADSGQGDVEAGLAAASTTVDATYTTPTIHQNPMEPHTAVTIWSEDGLTIYTGSQGASFTAMLLGRALGLEPAQVHVISPHVGGGFGAKAYPHAYAVLAALAARVLPGRPVRFALTRQQMFSLVGYRTPTIHRVQLGADAEGRLTAIAHDAIEQTSTGKEYAEQIAVCSRLMYAAPNRRTTHRVTALDVPPPTIMRAPGESQGMFALESAMDELAVAGGLDPVALRIRNEPRVHPESGLPFSSRNLVACLREGARRFGWEPRDPTPRARREGRWLVGTGVASSTYPYFPLPGSSATIRVTPGGRYTVSLAAADIGTGTWTVLHQIAEDALRVGEEDVDLQIGDSALPSASPAGMSSGVTCWGSAIIAAAEQLRTTLESEHGGSVPPDGLEVTADWTDHPDAASYSRHTFGAQFVEVRVDEDTGEVRVPRLVGVFAAGRIINPKLARSQMIGGMTQGMSTALHEHSVIDPQFGHVVNHDFAGYHVAANADVGAIEVAFVDEEDEHGNPMRSKGVGELGVVGTAAAIASAVYHATGVRVRDLPITLDKLL